MGDGSFSTAARAAIYEAGDGRCVGCGSAEITAQHRHARGMGGTSRDELAQAVNGLPLCGSGTTGCHGWAEHNPIDAELLGWRLVAGAAYTAPWWHRTYGWRRWVLDEAGVPMVQYVDETEVDRREFRALAILNLMADVKRRDPSNGDSTFPNRKTGAS